MVPAYAVPDMFEYLMNERELRRYFEYSAGDEQEGLRLKRNTTRSLYRLHLMLENARHSRLPTALLNIDPEVSFDSV